MGNYIGFHKNCSGKPLKELVFEYYDDFRTWYLQRNQESMDDFYEGEGSKELLAYFEQDTDFVNEFDTLDDRLINELSSEFVYIFINFNFTTTILFEQFGTNEKTGGYMESTEMVYHTKDPKFIELWTYLIQGRTLKKSLYFNTYNQIDRVGFLTVEEQSRLRELIVQYFGDVHARTDEYWSTTAVEEYKKISEGQSQGRLTAPHPPTAGLSAVLGALDDIKDEKVELVTTIE